MFPTKHQGSCKPYVTYVLVHSVQNHCYHVKITWPRHTRTHILNCIHHNQVIGFVLRRHISCVGKQNWTPSTIVPLKLVCCIFIWTRWHMPYLFFFLQRSALSSYSSLGTTKLALISVWQAKSIGPFRYPNWSCGRRLVQIKHTMKFTFLKPS